MYVYTQTCIRQFWDIVFLHPAFHRERFSPVPCNSWQFKPTPSLNSSKCLKIFHKRHIKAANSIKDICRHVVNTCRFLEDIFPQGMPCDFHVVSKTNSRSNCYFYRSAWTANTKLVQGSC